MRQVLNVDKWEIPKSTTASSQIRLGAFFSNLKVCWYEGAISIKMELFIIRSPG